MKPFVKTVRSGARGVLKTLAFFLMLAAPAAWAGVTVTLTAPTNGATFVPPVNITLSANATADQGYTLSKVEFFSGTTLIGTVLSAPYTFNWVNVPSALHSLTAKATAVKKNSPDQTATSTARSITVNAPPVVSITSPVPTAETFYDYPPPAITVNATASDSDGTIVMVEFFHLGPEETVTVTTPPYGFAWTLQPPFWELYEDEYGQPALGFRIYTIFAKATDNLGGTSWDQTGEIYVRPTLTLTSPVNGASFTAPAAINLTAAVNPPDFPTQTIQFYNGTTLIGEDTSAPYSFNWENVPAGNYSLTAKILAYGWEFPSSPVNVTVTAAAAQPNLHFIHVDHLNTPRLVADATGTTVWRWDQAEPFGNNPADEDPDANSVAFDLPLRLPGQRYDKETALHYNYFRDYDPSIGRYGESDPLGLRAGLNTYAYVANRALSATDVKGLAASPSPSSQAYPCGADGGSRLPHDFTAFNFKEACITHDLCYSICRKPKLICDGSFYDDLVRQCRGLPPAIFVVCHEAAYYYGSGVFYGGWSAYQEAQRKACQKFSCLPKDDASL